MGICLTFSGLATLTLIPMIDCTVAFYASTKSINFRLPSITEIKKPGINQVFQYEF
jgi:hypothetical protein